jgi:hypothetical protein
MQLKDLKLSDLVILEKDNLPALFNGPFKLRKTIYSDEGEVLGACWVRITAEISILLRPELRNVTKARAIYEIGKFLYDAIPSQLGISDSFITFDDESYEDYIKILKKHFDFKEVRALVTRRNDG